MNKFFYAELDGNNICKAISELSSQIIKDTMIQLEYFDETLLGQKYENGEWVIVEQEETYEFTEQELLQAEILLNQAEILAKQNEQDEVLAEILLNQLGV